MTMKEKPLAVLAGWLGCQQRSLRRYKHLFSQKGFQVMAKVASPIMVVESCFPKNPTPATLKCPPGWPAEKNGVNNNFVKRSTPPSSMQDLAWDLLGEVHSRNCPYFVFYAFSNGGCFVWEQVRNILDLGAESTNDESTIKAMNIDENQRQAIESLRSRTAGVVFDSCPSQHLALVSYALAYCSFRDRFEVMMSQGMDVAFFPSLLSEEKLKLGDVRSESYYRGLKEHPWDIPQLYLYSENDMLIPYKTVDELVDYRRNLIGRDSILCSKWTSSRHCAHLLDHPDEYTTIVESFLELCRHTKPTAKL